MTSVLDAITKLPRHIKVRSTNGIDENNAVVLDDKRSYDKQRKYQRDYYVRNRDRILAKKKIINSQPHIKQHNAEYHQRYYLIHRESLLSKSREYHRRRNGKILS